jgi:hypothetical protein
MSESPNGAILYPPTHMTGEVVRENGNADRRFGFQMEDDSLAIFLDGHPDKLANADLMHSFQPEQIAGDRNIVDLAASVPTD